MSSHMRGAFATSVSAGFCLVALTAAPAAQASARSAVPPRAQGAGRQPTTGQIRANLAQVMRGILFPNSNVIFAAQHDEFAAAKPDADTSLSTNPITGLYGGWEAVENSSLALIESANLITIPGRRCSNGRPVPTGDAEFVGFVRALREAGAKAYQAAQSKDQDRILDAADKVATACSHCHRAYRDKPLQQGGDANRCVK